MVEQRRTTPHRVRSYRRPNGRWKTLQRLRWLFIVAQLGGVSTQWHCVKLGNAILLEEDLFSESNTDDSDESDEWSEQSQWARFHDQQFFEEYYNYPPDASLGSQSD